MMTGVPRIFLESERMFLRQFTTDDADLLFRLDNDADVMLYVNGGIPVPLEEIVLDLAWFLSYYERFDGYGFWAAVEKTTGRFLGWFHFRPDEGAGPLEPELGYRLHRFAWNQGYATEGSRALVSKGFTELGVERVTAHAMAVNVGSRRVMEKAGLRFVRTLHHDWPIRIPGDEHGDVEYALDRSQWESDHTSE
jgi:RimJ/RimL family protein N-acetyltransferase